jgi:hypothetical protein
MRIVVIIFLCALTACSTTGRISDNSVWPAVSKIWAEAPHNAFTDLIRFKNAFYCSFREGSAHTPGTDGKVRILRSANGKRWESVALLESEGIDLRDPKLSVTPDGRLMVIIGGSYYKQRKLTGRLPHVSFSDAAGLHFSQPAPVTFGSGIPATGNWIWRVTWHNGTGYALDYQIGPEERRGPTAFFLLKTQDGKQYEQVAQLHIDGFPNESTIRFDDQNRMYMLIRRELKDKMGILATAVAPYDKQEQYPLPVRLGGPNFVLRGDSTLILGSRLYEGGSDKTSTGIMISDTKGHIRKTVRLPSAGDNSYPGMLIYKKHLWVSYYSTNRDSVTAVYITRIPLKKLCR